MLSVSLRRARRAPRKFGPPRCLVVSLGSQEGTAAVLDTRSPDALAAANVTQEAPTPKRRATAETMASRQREISVSEFFTKNRHLLGFDNPAKALLTTVKEAVDNSLDACEEAGILPDILVEITEVQPAASANQPSRFRVAIEDNGPGIVKPQIPKIFAKLLYGSKFHRLKQSRGQQGIGISAAGLYGAAHDRQAGGHHEQDGQGAAGLPHRAAHRHQAQPARRGEGRDRSTGTRSTARASRSSSSRPTAAAAPACRSTSSRRSSRTRTSRSRRSRPRASASSSRASRASCRARPTRSSRTPTASSSGCCR